MYCVGFTTFLTSTPPSPSPSPSPHTYHHIFHILQQPVYHILHTCQHVSDAYQVGNHWCSSPLTHFRDGFVQQLYSNSLGLKICHFHRNGTEYNSFSLARYTNLATV